MKITQEAFGKTITFEASDDMPFVEYMEILKLMACTVYSEGLWSDYFEEVNHQER